jgi:hypothetical protein
MNTAQKIATGWVSYAERNDLKVGTQKYWKAQHAFINGANALSPDGLPPIIQIYVMCGRDIADITKESQAVEDWTQTTV